MQMRAPSITRSALLCVAVTATLAVTGTASAAARTMYFRDGLGASARVTYHVAGKSVHYSGVLWDKKGDGYNARIYGVSSGREFGIRRSVLGRARAFRGASPLPTYFRVCTYDRNVPLRCTTRWTTT
jgi:hypothetical protein